MTGSKDRLAGLPTAGGPDFLVVGKVRRPHGVHGEVVAEIYTDFPERILPRKTIFLGEKHTKLVIATRRQHNEGMLLGFEGIVSPEQAGLLRNQVLSISISEVADLPEGSFYHHELINLQVFDDAGYALGILKEIIQTGANDVYVVINSFGHELLLPAIPDVILQIDLDAKKMKVHLLSGLLDKNWEDS